MIVKNLLNRFQMRDESMLGREVLMFGTARGSKDMVVDGSVVECADSTVVHADLTEKCHRADRS